MKETTRLCPFETSGSGLPGPFFLAIRVSRTQGVHLTGGLPMGSAKDIDTAAWEALKARTTPEQLAAA